MRSAISSILPTALAAFALGGCASQTAKPPSGDGATPPPVSAPAPAPAPAGETRTASSGGSAGQVPPGQTPDERRATIDRRLDGSLGAFDETLRKEQEAVAQERDAREAAAGSSQTEQSEAQVEGESGDPGSADGEGPPVAGSEGKPGESSSRPGDLKSDKDRAAKGGGVSGSGAAVGEIPDGSDDDIVARRLRKAAEQETDPELKEKLWKEYVEYKKNAGK